MKESIKKWWDWIKEFQKHHLTLEKDYCTLIQSFVTVAAFIVGGIWALNQFTVEREGQPHANIKQEITSVALSNETNLLRVNVEFINTGISKIELKKYVIIIYQVLPVPARVNKEIKYALANTDRRRDRFNWTKLAQRYNTLVLNKTHPDASIQSVEKSRRLSLYEPVEIEPGEKENMDFEFVIPSRIKVVRVYSYFENEKEHLIGWSVASYYDFRISQKENSR